jgi:hypothetical protein
MEALSTSMTAKLVIKKRTIRFMNADSGMTEEIVIVETRSARILALIPGGTIKDSAFSQLLDKIVS